MRLTDAEWAVLEALWSGESFALGELATELKNSLAAGELLNEAAGAVIAHDAMNSCCFL